MRLEDQKCMGCERGYESGGFVFQCLLRLCPGCHEAMGGSSGVVEFARSLEAELDLFRTKLTAERLMGPLKATVKT